ncbi:unnamed protein product (macronuclear) [Paramecium tetraurelia]|uniref:Uncharacterized protein n=1 Tax=Paramecium tetraurelia TaxID=5888 RepID=A0BL88_PARTE|nr:uncharacterized protein GSPATT00029937001 [Paramecium tetraurelia]CAK59305.1 unnamed protein product [Paramecium tetraurelia]|eukprot:XP_001426703.1 hypothetical protein (macronuclear) [Paramecium tetraurelia strain d4-2]
MIKYFFGSVKLFKKQGIQEATKATTTKLDLITNPELTKEDIANFDQFYSNIVKSMVVKENGRKKVIQQTYTPNIYQILESKIGNDHFQISAFLQFRRDQLREEEVVYCLDGLIRAKQFILLKNSDYLQHIDFLISNKKLSFTKVECLEQILIINKKLQFLSIDSLRLLAKQLNEIGQYIEKEFELTKNEEPLEILAQTFILAAQIEYNHTITQSQLIHVRKILKRHFKLLKFDTIMKYFVTIIKYQNKLQTELDSILDIEEFFGENYNVLTLENYLMIIEHLALIKYKKRSEVVIQFVNNISSFTFTIQQLAQLAKSLAIMEIRLDELWNRITAEFLQVIQLVDTHFYLGEITLVFQSLLKINPLSPQDLTTIYKAIKNITIDESFTIKFQILYNFSIKGHFNFDLFQDLCNYEKNNFQFKYLNNYKQEKLFEVTKVILYNSIFYNKLERLDENVDFGIQKALIILCTKIYEILSNPNYELKNSFQTYYDLFIVSSLFQKFIENSDGLQDVLINTKLENIRYEAGKKLDRKIQRNQFNIQEALKLLGFIDYFKVGYKEEAYQELVRMVQVKLIEYESDFDELNTLLHQYHIQNQKIMQEYITLILNKQAELTIEQLQKYSHVLKKSGNQSQELELIMIQRSLTSNSYLGVVGFDKPNYEVNFLFN